jgi:hypothetical protein
VVKLPEQGQAGRAGQAAARNLPAERRRRVVLMAARDDLIDSPGKFLGREMNGRVAFPASPVDFGRFPLKRGVGGDRLIRHV